MSDEHLEALLAKRAPKPRSKLTTVLAAILILLIGIFIGAMLGRGASTPAPPPQQAIVSMPAGQPAHEAPEGISR